MDIFEEIMLNVARSSAANVIRIGGDFEINGLLHCGCCCLPKQRYVEIAGENYLSGAACQCEIDEAEREYNAKEEKKRRDIIEYRREHCISDLAFRGLTFKEDNGSCPEAVEAARWYVDNFEQMKRGNKGLMFMGTVGTGKTFAACCIANELVERGYDIWLTTMLPLLRSAGDFNKCDAVFERVKRVDLLILDDFGTTKNTERNNELLFEIIDARLRSHKPLIITTNLSPADLKQPSDVSLARIYDRVIEMCSCEKSPVVLTGRSIRERIAREKHACRFPAFAV